MTDTTRDAFEAWYCKAYHHHTLQNKENGCYLSFQAGMAWDAWQAATEQSTRQPLTNEAIEILWTKLMCGRGSGDIGDFVRNVEAAHGIKA